MKRTVFMSDRKAPITQVDLLESRLGSHWPAIHKARNETTRLRQDLAALFHDAFLGTVSVFWLPLIVTYFFSSGGFAIVGPYAAEVWPASLRTSGMGSAYGFGGIGKIIGPLGLALIVGSSNVVKPEASVTMLIPAFVYLASWFAMAGIVYFFFGIETKGRSIEEIDGELAAPPLKAPRVAQ